jgi:hypothetical protein
MVISFCSLIIKGTIHGLVSLRGPDLDGARRLGTRRPKLLELQDAVTPGRLGRRRETSKIRPIQLIVRVCMLPG